MPESKSELSEMLIESVVVYLLVFVIVQWFGVARRQLIGLNIVLLALSLAAAAQTAWLWFCCQPMLRTLKDQDH